MKVSLDPADVPDWVQQMSPRPTIAGGDQLSLGENLAGVEVEMRWWAKDGEHLGRGPRQLIVTISDHASPQVTARGITSGVLRQIESSVINWLNTNSIQVTSDAKSAEEVFWADVRQMIRAMPDTPRSRTGDYYKGLLNVFEIVEAISSEPVNALLRELAACERPMTKNTLNTQLQRARHRRKARTEE